MARKTNPAKLEAEINASLDRARTARVQRDRIERPSPGRALGRVDHFLSEAQDQIGKHLANAETKTSSPDVYKIGNEAFDDIERLRWKLRKYNLR